MRQHRVAYFSWSKSCTVLDKSQNDTALLKDIFWAEFALKKGGVPLIIFKDREVSCSRN